MSHFSTLVLLPSLGGTPDQIEPESIESAVRGALEPFSEHSSCDGKWDWWQIGGRWTGHLDGYDPSTDQRNIKTCWLCEGTGRRTDMEVRNGCNGCDGTGRVLKHPTEWARHGGDARPASCVPDSFVPHAIVTPDGEWIERGEAGWFGTVSDAKPYWETEAKAVLKEHSDSLAVVVDCHV